MLLFLCLLSRQLSCAGGKNVLTPPMIFAQFLVTVFDQIQNQGRKPHANRTQYI